MFFLSAGLSCALRLKNYQKDRNNKIKNVKAKYEKWWKTDLKNRPKKDNTTMPDKKEIYQKQSPNT